MSSGDLTFYSGNSIGDVLRFTDYSIFDKPVGIGTTTPYHNLSVASSTAPQLSLTDGSLTSNQWTLRSAGGNLYFATSSPSTYATSTVSALSIDTNGKVTIPLLTASRAVFTDSTSGLTTTGTVGALESSVGSQNILLETEIDACSELAALLDVETGGCNGTSGPVFPDSPTFSGTITAVGLTMTGAYINETGSLEIPNGSNPTVDAIGEIALDTTANQFLIATSTDAASPLVLQGTDRLGFAYATTTWSATTTLRVGPAPANITVRYAYCETDTGTVGVSLYDGTNRALYIPTASTTINKITYPLSNASFTAGESIRVDVGTPASSPRNVSCGFSFTYDRQ
jgi:hypothetical protein